MSGHKLFEIVQAAVLRSGLSPQCSRLPTDDTNIQVLTGSYHILVSQNRNPLSADGFAGCLPQPITKMMMPDADKRVAMHTANSFVTIGKGMPVPEGARGFIDKIMGDSQSFTTWEDAKRAMELCYYLSRQLLANNNALAVHWCPSDHLVTNDFFVQAGSGKTLTPLFVRPYLFSSANQLRKGLPVGVVGNGSQYMLGRPVVFKEAQADATWMIQRVANFIDMCHMRGAVIPHGETFGATTEEVISVAHVPPSQESPLGAFELTAREVPEFGIRNNTSVAAVSVRSYEPSVKPSEKLDLDMNDPIDRAIMARLEERRQQERREQDTTVPYPNDRRSAGQSPNGFGRRGQAFGKRN